MLKESALVAFVTAFVLVTVVAVTAKACGKWKSSVNPGKDWDFKDSWATNATIGASALAAVFGSSDVATAVGGDDAVVAPLIVVGSAMALAVVTAAPLLVKVSFRGAKTWTVAIAAAAVLTLSAAGLEGLVIVRLAADLNLGGIESWTPIMGGAFGVLLAAYAVRSLWTIFTTDTEADFAPDARRRPAVL